MAAVELPALPRNAEIIFREVTRDRDLVPTFGGGPDAVQQRVGDRTAIEVRIPSLDAAGCGPGWMADLKAARKAGAIMAIPETLPAQDYGTPLVRGGGHTGKVLPIDGLPAGRVVPKGKWLSVTVAGRIYAYSTTADATANSSGEVNLPLQQMIRAVPADNAVVALAAPKIEGLIKQAVETPLYARAMSVSFVLQESR